MSNKTYYAIGDPHGMSDAVKMITTEIFMDIEEHGVENPHMIFLGDYVDRGPDSKGVIDIVRALQRPQPLQPDLKVTALLGNHEDQLVWCYDNINDPDCRENAEYWMTNYGQSAVNSWGVESVLDVPKDYIDWMRNLPHEWMDGENKICFVHAGVHPQDFPFINKHTAIWSRNDLLMDAMAGSDTEYKGWIIVHGHTPVNMPVVKKHRINVDTGACFRGALTCVKIDTATPGLYDLIDYDMDLQKIRRRVVDTNPMRV